MNFFSYVADAAKSPYAFAAYAMALAAWVVIAWRVQRYRVLLGHLSMIPESDRLEALRDEMGNPHGAEKMTAEQYLRSRIHIFLFVGYGLTIVAALVVVVIALNDGGSVTGSVD
jgi:hypothetical protein